MKLNVCSFLVKVVLTFCLPVFLNAATLLIQSNASIATVSIDKRSAGTTDTKGLAFLENLVVGTHTITLNLEGYESQTKRIKLSEKLTSILIFNLDIQDKIPPQIKLLSPEASRGIIPATDKKTVQIIGLVRDESGVSSVVVNRLPVILEAPNREQHDLFPGRTIRFSTELPLKTGENNFLIEAVDSAGNKETLELTVEREIKDDVLASLNCYALLIGINDYDHWQDLRYPVSEIQELGRELENSYGFQVQTLINPDKTSLLTTIRSYREKRFFKNDELLIVLSGHGFFDKDSKTGYFIPKGGKLRQNDPNLSSYINYPELNNILNNLIPCEHILVAIDACFAGTFNEVIAMKGDDNEGVVAELPREEFILRKLEFKSRMLLSSGGKVKVPDKSHFMYMFLEGLRNYGGKDRILTVEELRYNFMDNINPTPHLMQFGDNQPGSSFLFIAR